MSENSLKNSGSLAKGIFRKVLGGGRDGTMLSDRCGTVGRTIMNGARQIAYRNDAVKGTARLNREGYMVHNIPEGNEIFVSNPGDAAFFDDDEPSLIRISSEEFDLHSEEAAVVCTTEERRPEPDRLESMFLNAMSKPEYGEINYDEIIIRSDSSDDCIGTASAEAPVVALPVSVSVSSLADVAETPSPMDGLTMEVEGLHGGSAGRTEQALSDDDASQEVSFISDSVPETAMTSEVMRLPDVPMPLLSEPESIELISAESGSVVVNPIEIKDVVMDVMKLTIPSLDEDETILADFPARATKTIPEDGLESFDAKFKPNPLAIKRPTVSLRDSGRKPIRTIGSSLNFSF